MLLALGNRYESTGFTLIFIIAGVAFSHLAGLALPGVWWLPVLNGLIFFFLFRHPVSRGDYRTAVCLALVWAAVTSLAQILLTLGWPALLGRKVWYGLSYRDEMFAWVRSGAGPESDIRLFLPVQLKHLVIFVAASLASGGLCGLVMGAMLLGYMNYYVGSLIAASGGSWAAILLGWQVWAVVRVAGYIIAGTALGAVLLDRRGEGPDKRAGIQRLLALALALILLDILLKWALAGTYQVSLQPALAGRIPFRENIL